VKGVVKGSSQLTLARRAGELAGIMPRPLRVQFPGAIYHLMNRGDRREPIFKDDLDRQRFLATLSQACDKTSWQVHA